MGCTTIILTMWRKQVAGVSSLVGVAMIQSNAAAPLRGTIGGQQPSRVLVSCSRLSLKRLTWRSWNTGSVGLGDLIALFL